MRHPAQSYRQLSVQGASPLGLVVMLYDGAITALLRAIHAIETHDIEGKCRHLNRALAIIIQLEGTLNFDEGGEIARNLQGFYAYSRAKILQANAQNSMESLRPLIEYYTALRDAWKEGEQWLTIQESQAQDSSTAIHA
ncbi:MAG: flagellar export chaperone FliS [Terriglobia bacterium]|jgi:flagellar secretion chaperone FliS